MKCMSLTLDIKLALRACLSKLSDCRKKAYECLSELQDLELLLQTRENVLKSTYREGRSSYYTFCHPALLTYNLGPLTWGNHSAFFLSRCSGLRKLRLTLRDWKDNVLVFANIAKNNRLPGLRTLKLEHIRCRGEDLRRFLRTHDGLHSLCLLDLDITGSISFADVLGELATTHTVLDLFYSRHIAQNSWRTNFESCGDLGAADYGLPLALDEERYADSFDDEEESDFFFWMSSFM
jgi:hypothetical protein